MSYAELHCITNFTFLRGASHPEELVQQAVKLGYQALAITDECSLAGVVRAHSERKRLFEECDEQFDKAVKASIGNFKLIIGSEFQCSDGPQLVLLAKNLEGYAELSGLITQARRAAKKGEYLIDSATLAQATNCLVLWVPPPDLAFMWSPDHSTTLDDTTTTTWHSTSTLGLRTGSIQAVSRGDVECQVDHQHVENAATDTILHTAQELKSQFGDRLWLAVSLHVDGRDTSRLRRLLAFAEAVDIPAVASGEVHMHKRGRRALQDTLTAIRHCTPVDTTGFGLHSNGERHLRTLETLTRLYPQALIDASIAIAEQCTFSLEQLQYEYPAEVVPDTYTPQDYLRELTYAGARKRWPQGLSRHVRTLIEHELVLIDELNYAKYFLTVYDIVRFARSRNILCQGRGSAANSAVCYSLGVTAVDPARMSMLFERFISKERNEPPDIDIDFEHERREEVIQYIYQKYGRDRAALTATVICYRPRSAMRDVGKALGLADLQTDRLARAMQWWDGKKISDERVREAGFEPNNPMIHRVLTMVRELLGFPRHLSQHVGGFVMSNQPLHTLVPIENAAMDDRTVIQWDKDDLEDLGLLKVDVLGLGMLTAIRRSFELIKNFRQQQWSLATIPAEDPAVYEMISRGDTVGVFQIESRAQMSMLPRLRPRCFYDLVIEVAIVRPGPIQGDMVHPYLRRRNGEEPVSYPSDAVRGVLQRTLGVPIFQEQVMHLAMVAAGFSAGEADQLRRAMAAWKRKGGLGSFEGKLIDGMLERGYQQEFAEKVFRQIQGFGEYGFPESHAASFALLVYVSSWLKLYEPAAFFAAMLNSLPMGFYAPAQLVRAAKSHNVKILPVTVNDSEWDCSLEADPTSAEHQRRTAMLRLGFSRIKGFSEEAAERLINARTKGLYTRTSEVAQRAQLNKRDMELLASSGALKILAGNRHKARWEVAGIEPSMPLIPEVTFQEADPLLTPPEEGDDLVADYESISLTLGRHPMAVLRPQFAAMTLRAADQLWDLPEGSSVQLVGVVITRQRPGTASGVTFVTMEDETGHVNLVVWKKIAERYRKALIGARLLRVVGEVQQESGVLHVIAHALFDESARLSGLLTSSRDFH